MMFDILVYLFENYFEANLHPDQGTLEKELSAAGFDSSEINLAFDWLNGLDKLSNVAISRKPGKQYFYSYLRRIWKLKKSIPRAEASCLSLKFPTLLIRFSANG